MCLELFSHTHRRSSDLSEMASDVVVNGDVQVFILTVPLATPPRSNLQMASNKISKPFLAVFH